MEEARAADDAALRLTRRHFFGRAATGIGTAALASLLPAGMRAAPTPAGEPGVLAQLHRRARAKRIIYLFMSGAPSQIDLLDYKPKLVEMFDKDLPESVRQGQRLTTMTSGQARFPLAPSIFKFSRHGRGGAWISELLPETAQVADELCIVKSLHTEAINHDPAITYIITGSQIPGRPSLGSWLAYGLGSDNRDLPGFVVLHSRWSSKAAAQPVFSRLWGSGFLPTRFQGASLRSDGDPVLYLSNPPGVSSATRRRMLDGVVGLNRRRQEAIGDPEIGSRIAQYEMAFRMQFSVPELTDLSSEPERSFALYGPDSRSPGSFAANCLLARRLAERGVKFIQIFHRGWDQHGNLPNDIRDQCRDVDRPCYGLITDLKERGLLEDTLVVWGGEFGRTVYCQGGLTRENYGRDHHPRCFTIWMAGGGVQPGTVYGETDDFSYNVTADPVHIHDLNATMLHLLGIDHEKLTFKFQGRDFRLTDVHGKVVHDIVI